MVEFRLLGGPEMLVGRRATHLGSPKQRVVLVALLLAAGQPVAVDSLAQQVWGDRLPGRYRNVLASYVSRLRRLLAAGAPDGSLAIRFRHGGYELCCRPEWIDLHRFRDAVTRARTSVTAGDEAAAEADLTRVLRLWQGPALFGLPGDWAAETAERLHRERREAEVLRAQALLRLGRSGEVVDDLHQLAAEHPFDEQLATLLMDALDGSGRTAEALTQYHSLRRRLAEHLGVEPSTTAQQRYLLLLRRDPAPPPGRQTAPEHRVVVPAQLPPGIGDFTGRDSEYDTLVRLLRGSAGNATLGPVTQIALAGMAGIGKTTLAVRVAHAIRHEFPDGQLFVNLGGMDTEPVDPADVLSRLLRALGVDRRAVPTGLVERTALYRSIVADRRVLVVLDNAGDERQVEPLLPGGSGCAVVVTNRSILSGLSGLRTIRLDILDEKDAIELLVRVGGLDDVDAPALGRLAELCGRLPLALRICGAHLASRPDATPRDLVRRMTREPGPLDELSGGHLDVRRSLSLSYHGLTSGARWLLRGLGQSPTPDVVCWLCAAILDSTLTDAERLVTELFHAGMLMPAGRDRFRLHDLVRRYALERAEAEDTPEDRHGTISRVLGAWLDLTRRARTRLAGDHQTIHGIARRWRLAEADDLVADPVGWFDVERTGFVAAVQQAATVGLDELCWDLACTASPLYQAGCHVDEWRMTSEVALAATEEAGNLRGEAAARAEMGALHIFQGRLAEAVGWVRSAIRTFETANEPLGAAMCTLDLVTIEYRQGNFPAALRLLGRAAPALSDLGAAVDEKVLRVSGAIHLAAGRPATALENYRRALAIARETGRGPHECESSIGAGKALLALGDTAAADEYHERSLAIARRLGMPKGVALAMWGLGRSRHLSGAYVEAANLLTEALDIAVTAEARDVQGVVLLALGEVRRAEGHHTVAHALLTEAQRLFTDQGAKHLVARANELLALG